MSGIHIGGGRNIRETMDCCWKSHSLGGSLVLRFWAFYLRYSYVLGQITFCIGVLSLGLAKKGTRKSEVFGSWR